MKLKILLLLLVLPAFVFGQNYKKQLAEIDKYAEKVRTDWNVPGFAIAVVKDDKVIFTKGYGIRELGKTDKVDENTLFAIASNSKAFTAVSLAMLVDEGKLNWDDKVTKYLPNFQMPDDWITREITVRDLVSHRSGLGTFSGDLLWYDTTYTDDEVISRLKYLKPVNGFRAGYGYQNLMFIAAGKVIEKISGKTWQDFVKERILMPLGMNRTTASVKDLKDNVSAPHNESGGKLRQLPHGNVDSARAAAGLNSSVAELAQWLRLQLGNGKFNGKLLYSEKQSWEMWQQSLPIKISDTAMKFNPTRHFNGYGLGWFLNDYQGRKVVSHGGGLDGMISLTAMMPEENLGLVVLTNSESPVNVIMQNKIFDAMLGVKKRDWSGDYLTRAKAAKNDEAIENKKIEDSRLQNTKPTLANSDYAGTYTSNLYGDVKISEENGKLVLRLVPAPNFVADLEHWENDKFLIKWRSSVNYNFPKGFAIFIAKNGKSDEMNIDQPNSDFWFYELDLKRSK
jgi:CubicO group peptidase (beta-lactamase class C family)